MDAPNEEYSHCALGYFAESVFDSRASDSGYLRGLIFFKSWI